MREISREDTGKMIMFLNGMSVVPGVGPSFDPYSGKDFSDLANKETVELDDFIDEFNNKYAEKAYDKSFMGMEVIMVKDFIEDGDTYADIENPQETFDGIISSWYMFDLTPFEEEQLKAKLKHMLHLD